MIDIRIAAAIVSTYIRLLLATPIRWFQHGWRDFTGYPSLDIMNIVESELTPRSVARLVITMKDQRPSISINSQVLRPFSLRLLERQQMERERQWRDEQMRQIAAMQRDEREKD
ncbi:hypothetical protein PFISCL1PPCAC_25360, partial [Pristionchus fissidentatus]